MATWREGETERERADKLEDKRDREEETEGTKETPDGTTRPSWKRRHGLVGTAQATHLPQASLSSVLTAACVISSL